MSEYVRRALAKLTIFVSSYGGSHEPITPTRSPSPITYEKVEEEKKDTNKKIPRTYSFLQKDHSLTVMQSCSVHPIRCPSDCNDDMDVSMDRTRKDATME